MFQNLYAGGAPETAEEEILYDTWKLCITQLDTSALPLQSKMMGNIITRSMVDQLSSLNARVRPPEEISRYTEYAWTQGRLEAGQKLKSKRDERDALLFKGETNWTYKNKIKKIDEEIKTLEEEYTLQEAVFPLIAEYPSFSLTEQNIEGTYPPVPESGMEYAFCKEQNVDGFLSGIVTEYYGRIYVSIKLYTLYTQSFIYEDYALFSVEDQQVILSETFTRLKAVLSGIEPASILVKAEPEEAFILINETYAGQGNSGEKTQSPGTTQIEVFADEYEMEDIEIDLFTGEFAEVFINLKPIAYQAFNIDTSNGLPASVYRGSTFVGMTPLSLTMQPNQYEHFILENDQEETAEFVYGGVSSSAVIRLALNEPNPKTVEDYRKGFYGAYGRFWISLPIAFLMYGVATSAVSASNYSGNPDMRNNAEWSRGIFYGSAAVAGGFFLESLIRMGFYLYQSNKTNVNIIR
jgi:hypothetical protein